MTLRSAKRCGSCRRLKPLSDFGPRGDRRAFRPASEFSAVRSVCRRCHALAHWQSRYGLSPNLRRKLLRYQHGRCLFCGLKLREFEAVLDHDHDNEGGDAGGARGLVHPFCNLLISTHDRASAAMLSNYLSLRVYPAQLVWATAGGR